MSIWREERPLYERVGVREWLSALATLALLGVLCWCLAGCVGTVTPAQVQGSAGAYSGNDKNSGVIEVLPAGIHVTAGAFARYGALVGRYGKGTPDHPFLPALTVKTGVTALPDGTYVIDREHFADWSLMASWARSGATP